MSDLLELAAIIMINWSLGFLVSRELFAPPNTNPVTGKNGYAERNGLSLDVNLESLRAIAADPGTLPGNCEIREPIFSDTFERKYINNGVGWGMVATQDIPSGAIIFADELMTLWEREEDACRSHQELNEMIGRKAEKMGLDWYARFLLLSGAQEMKKMGARERKLGFMGAIWDKHHLPTAWNGKVGGVLGLNLAWVNHSCVPNCTLRFVEERDKNKHGQVRRDEKPRLRGVVLRSSAVIRSGMEISISYMQTQGTADMRRKDTKRRFGFRCACRICMTPQSSVEDGLYKYHRLKAALTDPKVIADKPAIAFHIAFQLSNLLFRLRIYDNRLIDIWIKCALIAGHHSDLARAYCFLRKAREFILIVEGLTGGSPTIMPGFGGTRRGLSALAEATSMLDGRPNAKIMMYMIGAPSDEYVRVSRYRSCFTSEESEKKADKNKPAPKKEYLKIFYGPDPVPQELNISAKGPYDMCRGLHDCHVPGQMERRARKRRTHHKNQTHLENREVRKHLDSGCVDPEKDFLEAYLGMAYENFGSILKRWLNGELKLDASEAGSEQPGELNKCLGEGSKRKDCAQGHRDEVKGVEREDICDCDDIPGKEKQQERVQPAEKQGKKQKSKQKRKKKKDKQKPAVRDVGAEKEVTLVGLEDHFFCDAGVESCI
ncbi:hypothetical protein BDW62DRAFT_211379 [Aspergillus aurantiobrunneus]